MPAELLPGQADVRPPLGRVVGRQRLEDDLRTRTRQPDHLFGQLADGELAGIAEVDRPDKTVGIVHHPEQPLDHVVHKAEGAGLAAVTEDRDVPSGERLHDEVADHPAVIGVHARSIGIEDAHHANVEFVLAVVIEEQGLCAALAFIVAGAQPDTVDVTPVIFGLGVHGGVPVDLGG